MTTLTSGASLASPAQLPRSGQGRHCQRAAVCVGTAAPLHRHPLLAFSLTTPRSQEVIISLFSCVWQSSDSTHTGRVLQPGQPSPHTHAGRCGERGSTKALNCQTYMHRRVGTETTQHHRFRTTVPAILYLSPLSSYLCFCVWRDNAAAAAAAPPRPVSSTLRKADTPRA